MNKGLMMNTNQLVVGTAIDNYVVGFVVEDLDGNQYPVYETITVE